MISLASLFGGPTGLPTPNGPQGIPGVIPNSGMPAPVPAPQSGPTFSVPTATLPNTPPRTVGAPAAPAAPATPQYGPTQNFPNAYGFGLGAGKFGARTAAPELGSLIFGKLFGMNDEDEAERHIAKMKEDGVIGDAPHQVSENEARQYMISGGLEANKTVSDYGIESGITSLGGALADAVGKGSTTGGNVAAIGGSVAVPMTEHFGLPRWLGKTVTLGMGVGNAKDGSFGGRKDIMENNAYGVRAYQMAKWGRDKIDQDFKSGLISKQDYIDAKTELGELPPLTSYFKPRDKTMSPARKSITPEYSPRSDEELKKLRRP